MAAGTVIEPKSQLIVANIGEIKVAFARLARIRAFMIAAKGGSAGTDWAGLAAAIGEGSDQAAATAAQAIWENIDAIYSYMVGANDAASPMDGGAV